MSHLGWSNEEKDHIWTKHYMMVHEERCGCDFPDDEKCLYDIEKWSREMGISKKAALAHIKYSKSEKSEGVKDPKCDIIVTQKEIGKRSYGSIHIHVRCTEKEKEKMITRAKSNGMKLNEYILYSTIGK
jgi:hypothetical protein